MADMSDSHARAVFYDPETARWMVFGTVHEVRWVHAPAAVAEALATAQAEADRGRWTVGYVCYEAAAGLDPKLPVRQLSSMPLAWFATCDPPRSVDSSDLPPPGTFSLGGLRSTLDAARHATGIRTIREAIARGDTYQVNYTHRLEGPFRGSPWGLFQRLWSNQRADYSAWIETDRHVVCSASPELFFELDGERIVSRPMKGTAPRGLTTTEDRQRAAELAASPKNRAENVMIVDMIRNDLGRIARAGSVNVASLFDVERYRSVFQLTSTVEARTTAPIDEIFRALFPCASITGAPKRRTMELITELERQARGLYTGAIGWIAPGRRARFSVAIRTAVIDREASTLSYGTGGGIVWDSEPKAEYRECLDKTLVLTREPRDVTLLETLLWRPDSGYRLLQRHLDRLADSAVYFDLRIDREEVAQRLALECEQWVEPRRVRLTVKDGGPIEVSSAPFVRRPVPWTLALAASAIDRHDVRLFHKTTDRSLYEAAAAVQGDADDVLLWNDDGEITETTVGNILYDLEGALWTPPIACGLLAGTERAELLASGRVGERVLAVSELERCRGLSVVNSVHGIVLARLVDPAAPTA